MTEKRFTKCDTKIRDDGEEMTQAEVRDMLNKLHEENEKLKAICKDHRDHAIDFKADCVRLEKENEQLKSEIEKLSYTNEDLLEEKRIWKQMSDEYTKLSDENEQLRKDATTLIYANQDYRHENEQLREQLEDANELNKIYVDFMVDNGFELSDVVEWSKKDI